MTQLLLDNEGREAIREGIIHLAKRRLSRRWKRAFVVAFEAWRISGTFDRSVLIDAMNDAHDDEVRDLYRLLASVGALPVTIGDLEYNVNQDTGSDITGDGSAAAPYATMWFLDYLPATIRYHVRILIHSDHSEYNINTSRFVFEQDGFLTFSGVSAPEVLSSGHLADSVLLGYNATHFAAPVALEEALAGGWWVQKTNAGIYQNWAAPILSNKPDIVYYPAGDGTELIVAAADTVRFIRPALTLTVKNLVLAHKATYQRLGMYYASNRVTFCNLRVDVDQSASGITKNAVIEAPTAFTFCSLISKNSLHIDGKINASASSDAALDTVSESTVKNLSSTTAGMGPGVNTAGLHIKDQSVFLLNRALIRDAVIDAGFLLCFGTSRLRAVGVRGEIDMINCLLSDDFENIDQYSAPFSYILSLVPADGGNTFNVYNSHSRIANVRFVNRSLELNNAFLQWWGSCHLSLLSCGGDTTVPAFFPHSQPDFGIYAGTWGTRLFLGDLILEWDPTHAEVDLQGAIADVRFDDAPALPTQVAYPAIYADVSDINGFGRVCRGAV